MARTAGTPSASEFTLHSDGATRDSHVESFLFCIVTFRFNYTWTTDSRSTSVPKTTAAELVPD